MSKGAFRHIAKSSSAAERTYGPVLMLPSRRLVRPAADDDSTPPTLRGMSHIHFRTQWIITTQIKISKVDFFAKMFLNYIPLTFFVKGSKLDV